MAWSTAFSQSLFWAGWPRTAFVHLGGLTLWREGALHGITQSARFVTLSAAGLLLARPLPAEFAAMALGASEYRRSVSHLFPAAEQEALGHAH